MLAGEMSGKSRNELLAKATERAVEYYGKGCVRVTLHNERPRGFDFVAEFTAVEFHDLMPVHVGFPYCRKCNKRSYELEAPDAR